MFQASQKGKEQKYKANISNKNKPKFNGSSSKKVTFYHVLFAKKQITLKKIVGIKTNPILNAIFVTKLVTLKSTVENPC